MRAMNPFLHILKWEKEYSEPQIAFLEWNLKQTWQ